jgi:hypothetical protein
MDAYRNNNLSITFLHDVNRLFIHKTYSSHIVIYPNHFGYLLINYLKHGIKWIIKNYQNSTKLFVEVDYIIKQ